MRLFYSFLLGLVVAFGVSVLAQTSEDISTGLLTDTIPLSYSYSDVVSSEVDSLIASTSLDFVGATEIVKARMANEPYVREISDKLDVIIELLASIARKR